jgi:hypothetical protein
LLASLLCFLLLQICRAPIRDVVRVYGVGSADEPEQSTQAG